LGLRNRVHLEGIQGSPVSGKTWQGHPHR
jgi:hypothetical protein